VAEPQITPRRALALMATVADSQDVLEADTEAGQVITPARRLQLIAMMADCEGILETERLRLEAEERDEELAQRKPGRSALTPEPPR
jgi:hypothetical protein